MNAEGPQALRRAAIVAAARELFFSRGYGATSMSAVAARLGGSKTTLWAYFRSKEELFAAVVDELVERFGQAISVPLDPALPPEAALRAFADTMMTIVLQPEIIQLHRIVAGEAGRFPELGRLFFERGPKRGKARLAAYLATAMADGRLRAGDAEVAARHFAALCQAGIHQQLIWGLEEAPDTDTLACDIEDAVALFLRAWAVPATPPAATPRAGSRHPSSANA